MRVGKKKQPTYRIVVADERKPRDGRFIEILGQYAPREEPSIVNLNNERALHWLNNGAQPTETAAKLLEVAGVWDEYKAAAGKVAAAKPKVKVKAKAVKEAPPAPEPAAQSTPTDIKLCGMRPGLLARLGFILARQGKSLPLRWRLSLFFFRPGFAGALPSRYFPLELALVLTPRRQVEWLRTTFHRTGLFRRYLDK
jgi:small subunit ribosomal protein S16